LSVNPYSGGVDSGGFPNANHSNNNSQDQQLYQDSFGMAGGLYDIKPALSMIVEEKSPRNAGVASPRNGSSAGGASPRSAHSGQQVDRNNSFGSSNQSPRGNQSPSNSNSQQGFGRDEFVAQPPSPPPPLQTHTSGGSAPQAQQIMSPTHLNSGMKPPLTPNRGMGGPSSSGNSRLSTGSNGSGGESQQNNLTPSQYRSPQPPPNNSSRLNQFNNPNNSPGNSMSSGTSNSGLGINGMTIETNNSDTIRQSMSPDDTSELRGMRLATADSADMCLSADSADEEYNRLRSPDPPGANGTSSNGVSNNTNGVTAAANKGKQQEKFVSALDRSPFSYSGEEDDNALFPALVEDKDPWNSNTSAWPKQMTSSQTTNQMETQEDIRAWTPQASSSKKGTSFTFDNSTQPMFSGGPMSSSPANGKDEKNLFEMNFADFEPFDPSQQFMSSSNTSNNNKAATQSSSSKSVAVNSSPVSALLEDSRARRKSRESSQRSIEGGGAGGVHSFSARNTRSGGSINSAPALNASQIRSTIRSSKGHHFTNNGSSSSISRVIDNLELHVNKRQSGGLSSTRSTSARSQSSASGHSRSNDGTTAIREAKERIRRENMMNNESKMIDMLAAGGSSAKAASAAAAATHEKKKDDWLFDEVVGTLGPRSVAADLESLGGRSGKSHRSSKSHRSHRSKKSSSRRHGESSSHRRRHRSSRHHDRDHRDDGVSVDSRTSRNSRASYRSYQTTKSMVSQMSEQSRSVANDLLRLEAQLSMVGKSRNGGSVAGGGGGASTTSGSVSGVPKGIGGSGNSSVISKTELNKRRDDCGMTVTSGYSSMSRSRSSRHHSSGRSRNRDHISASARRAAARTLRSKVTVKAPPGKLGIILANRTDSRGTVVSGVRTSSVLAEQVSPGDRIIAIDDEDVSQMNVKEITTIMARKSEFERVLVLLAAPKVQYD